MKKFIIALTFILLFSGCYENDDPHFILPEDYVDVPFSPIYTRINIGIFEEIEQSGRVIKLLLTTEDVYSPAGSKILGSISRNGNIYQIKLDELDISDCGAAITVPAMAFFELGDMDDGEYWLSIGINDDTVNAIITVSEQSFYFTLQRNSILTINQNPILRIPQTTIWGQAESIMSEPYRLFLDSLLILGAEPHGLQAGNYRYFEVFSPDSFDTHSAMGMRYGEYFLYNFDPDTLILRNLVKRFAIRYDDSIYVRLDGGRGELFRSTVLKHEP